MNPTEDIIEKYNKTAAEYAQSRIGTEDKEKLEKFRRLLKPKATVLDVGCAAGRDTIILKGMDFEVTGTDLAQKLLDIARRTYPDILFVLADMRKLPFETEIFDAIWASAVLHHVSREDIPAVLKEFKRILKPNGILYIHTKAGHGTLKTKEAAVANEERSFTLLTKEELHSLLASDYEKIALEEKESKTRKGLMWLSGFYKKKS